MVAVWNDGSGGSGIVDGYADKGDTISYTFTVCPRKRLLFCACKHAFHRQQWVVLSVVLPPYCNIWYQVQYSNNTVMIATFPPTLQHSRTVQRFTVYALYCLVSCLSQVNNNGNVQLSDIELVHEGRLLSCDHPSSLYPADETYKCRGKVSLGWEEIEAGFLNTSAT